MMCLLFLNCKMCFLCLNREMFYVWIVRCFMFETWDIFFIIEFLDMFVIIDKTAAGSCISHYHCVKSGSIQSFSDAYSVEIRETWTRKTPNRDTFHAVFWCLYAVLNVIWPSTQECLQVAFQFRMCVHWDM